MKTRIGFVSNSSSTSYVIYLPSILNADDVVMEYDDKISKKYKERMTNAQKKALVAAIGRLMKKTVLSDRELLGNGCDLESDEEDEDEDEDADISEIEDVLEKYTIASFDTGPDEGIWINVNSPGAQEKIRKLQR